MWDDPALYPPGSGSWRHDPIEFHDFLTAVGAEAMITANLATKDAAYAAKWVAWAKAKGYGWKWWEVGNEYEIAPGQWRTDTKNLPSRLETVAFRSA